MNRPAHIDPAERTLTVSPEGGDIVERSTNVVDIVEDTLGFELSPKHARKISGLSDDILTALARALRAHAESEYIRPPTLEADDVCLIAHEDGDLNRRLGGSGRRFGLTLGSSPDQLTGNLFLSLMYLPRIAIRDGLMYYLDNWLYGPPSSKGRELYLPAVHDLLKFYSRVRPLITNQTLVLLPASLWNEVHGGARSNSAAGGSESEQQWLNERAAFRQSVRSGVFLDELEKAYPPVDYRTAKDWERIVLHGGLDEVRELLLFAAAAEYSPVLETVNQQAAFSFLALNDFTMPKPEITRRIEQHAVAVPILARLSPEDFLAARDATAFAMFRKSIEDIAKEARSVASPVEFKRMVELILGDARAQVDEDISKSRTLRQCFTNVREVAIGAVFTNVAIAAVDPTWLDKPWRVAITTVAAAGAKVFNSYLSSESRAGDKAVARLFASLLPDAETQTGMAS